MALGAFSSIYWGYWLAVWHICPGALNPTDYGFAGIWPIKIHRPSKAGILKDGFVRGSGNWVTSIIDLWTEGSKCFSVPMIDLQNTGANCFRPHDRPPKQRSIICSFFFIFEPFEIHKMRYQNKINISILKWNFPFFNRISNF